MSAFPACQGHTTMTYYHALYSNFPLTDALERDILEDSLNEQSAVHFLAAIKHVTHLVRTGVDACFNLIESVQDTMSHPAW
jgi:hypothetical protein